MSITDELRKYAGRLSYEAARKSEHGFSPVAMKLEGIADRIDAEMVELPKDADGVPIHVGDVMWQKDRITKRTCKAIMGDAYVMLDGIQGAVYAKGLTHYHEPTVEDVLIKMLEKAVGYSDAHTTVALNAIAEYSAKLRLAGDGEEQ